ncbi:MAG: hypothetical protein J6Y02_20785 [Pseudobutyrivibrio sp.]|nr:hypothetical protein [Pseudobutyrivibrio sp.]
MLKIVIPGREFFDENKNEFVYTKPQEVTLEHSLISISKWESKWHKPFLDEKHEKTSEEFNDYVRCMSLSNVPDEVFENISERNKADIVSYIYDTMTATWFADDKTPAPVNKIITSEVIYSWMIQNEIPFDPCQKWHLNRLLTLIKVCSLENMPAKKMSPMSILSQNASLNKMRRAALHTKG